MDNELQLSNASREVTTKFGKSPWTREEMIASLPEFAEIYAQRPIKDNMGGMSSSHMFPFWFLLRAIRPKVVIESGVWKGQGTWLIEQTCPDADIYSIDINFSNLVYRSPKVQYLDRDFTTYNWDHVPAHSTLAFIDDHIDAMKRLRACVKYGFRHFIYEDNYPPGQGDCYSPKKAMMCAGHKAFPGLKAAISRMLGRLQDRTIPPNEDDAKYIRQVAEIYEELPPIFKLPVTRWGVPWDNRYPTEEPLLTKVEEPYQQIFLDEAKWYTWISYMQLRTA